MATETLEANTTVPDPPPKEEHCVANSVKETAKKEAPASDDDADMEEKGEVDDGEIDEEEITGKEGKSSEKEPVTPVSERPTRIKKKVERFILPTPSRSSGSKPVSIEQGRGTQLKEIPNVAYKLSKRKPDDNLFLLHTILFGKKGKAQTLKRNIGQFSGFVWTEKEEEKQRAKAKEKLEKCIKEKLIDFCDVFDIPINKSNVKKEELTVRVLEFLVNPKATRDIVLADSEKESKKRKKSTPKNVTSAESSDVPAKRRRQTKESGKKQDQPSQAEEGKDEGDVGSEGTNDSHGEDDAAPEKAEEKKSTDKKRSSKRTKKEKPAPQEEKSLKRSSKSGGRSSKQVEKPTSSSSKKQTADKDSSSKEKGKKQASKQEGKGSKDQEKASKKGKTEPTRKEMLVVVAEILKEVDFNTATLSDILRKLGSHFGVDLMHRKAEVKDIITDAINEMSDDDEGEENTEDENEKEKEEKERKG
ncbi:unnamed protein product [Microthlaspi erraticum]|uniref:DEK-C domain-containing protein n=1 Tax=Microthlaspi erraticum TaxID=1685480 RepID=A0A6D2L4Z7_9BRAS|nr:unnamed protein product [Microthlaspi erraticum]